MLIEIKGVQFVNKGAELMLYSILDKISTHWPHAEICMEPDSNSPYLKRAEIKAYQKLRLVKNRFDFNGLSYWLPNSVRRFFKNTLGIVTEVDVDVIIDASGFLYSEQWHYLPFLQTSSIAKRFRKKHKAYILMPQALGPFVSKKYRKVARELFENAAVVYARDMQSLSYANEITQKAVVKLAPDFTNLLVPNLPSDYRHLTQKVAIVPNSKMISTSNGNELWRLKYVEILAQIITTAQRLGQDVFLLNHEGKDDRVLCELINNALPEPIEVVEPDNCMTIKAIIGHCSWVVSSRFHGCVSALSQSVPCLGTSWSHKYEALFDDYDHNEWLINIKLDAFSLESFITNFVNDIEPNRLSLNAPADRIKAEAEAVWSSISDTVN